MFRLTPIPVNFWMTAAHVSGTSHKCESLHQQENCTRVLYDTSSCVCTQLGRACENRSPLMFSVETVNLLLYCHNITQKPFLFLLLLWFYIYLPRSRKDMQKWTRYSSILRTSQLRCFRGGLLSLSECSNRALEPEFCSQLCRYWLLLWIDFLTFLCLQFFACLLF